MLREKFAFLSFMIVSIVFLLKWNIRIVFIACFMDVVTIREDKVKMGIFQDYYTFSVRKYSSI